jgi:mRNA interferase RelE/StbE
VSYNVNIHREARKFLQSQEKTIQAHIITAIEGLRNPPPIGDISKMEGMRGFYRLRVGNNRIIFSYDHKEKQIYIRAIGPRGDIYK